MESTRRKDILMESTRRNTLELGCRTRMRALYTNKLD